MTPIEVANMNASASAEANAVKVSGNTVELNIGNGNGGFPDKILRAINPVWYERREAKAREIQSDSLKKTIDTLLEGCPVMTRRRAVMEAMGYHMTNEHADNFFAVADMASTVLDEESCILNPVSPEARDSIVDGASHAYNDDARTLWSRILAGEINKPGSFSKRAMSLLSDMGKRDIEIFKLFCSACISPLNSKEKSAVCYSVVVEDESPGAYNGGSLRHVDLMQLESMGLIDRSSCRFIKMKSKDRVWFLAGGSPTAVECISDKGGEISFSPVLTSCGIELSALCEIGCMENIGYCLAKKVMSKGGFSVYSSASAEIGSSHKNDD